LRFRKQFYVSEGLYTQTKPPIRNRFPSPRANNKQAHLPIAVGTAQHIISAANQSISLPFAGKHISTSNHQPAFFRQAHQHIKLSAHYHISLPFAGKHISTLAH
jgi:hypothetical protein